MGVQTVRAKHSDTDAVQRLSMTAAASFNRGNWGQAYRPASPLDTACAHAKSSICSASRAKAASRQLAALKVASATITATKPK